MKNVLKLGTPFLITVLLSKTKFPMVHNQMVWMVVKFSYSLQMSYG